MSHALYPKPYLNPKPDHNFNSQKVRLDEN